jgi:hypothetical protein
MISTPHSFTAFEGHNRIATGDLPTVALKTQELIHRGEKAPMLIFDDGTGEQVEIDFRGSAQDVLDRLSENSSFAPTPSEMPSPAPRGPGRPKLGVVAREVTLLPRHWEWLATQPGGASVALRKLVEESRRSNSAHDRLRKAQEATYRFLAAIAGNLPNFEEAARALFARDQSRFNNLTNAWPIDIHHHAQKLAAPAFEAQPL